MSEMASRQNPLKWDVFVAKRQGITRDLPPGKEQLNWVGGSATLIYGESDAVLVDTLLTVEQNRSLADWIAARGKNLTKIYITHGHGDHFFGLGLLFDRFPGAKAVARPNVVRLMQRQASTEYLANFWSPRYPGQIPDRPVIADELRGSAIDLEGRALLAVELGNTDTYHTTYDNEQKAPVCCYVIQWQTAVL